jgi:malonyl-CoA decarboxylase
VAKELRSQGIANFSTLSPLRSGTVESSNGETGEIPVSGFAEWLKETLKNSTPLLDDAKRELLNQALRNYGNLCVDSEHPIIGPIMKSMGYHYLTQVKLSGGISVQDRVANFHLGNGAMLANIHYIPPHAGAPTSDMAGAYGLMVNYRYEPEHLATRKAAYKTTGEIAIAPELQEEYAAKLKELRAPIAHINSATAKTTAILNAVNRRF